MVSSIAQETFGDVAPIWRLRTCVKPLILSRNAPYPARRSQPLNARPLRRSSLSLYPKASNNNPAAAGGGLAVISRLALTALLSLAAFTPASAQQPGISDTEIKFGNIMPYSGPASALSVTGKVFAGYFDMINEKGGVNGRKLNMISLDDGFSPPKTVEATRRLVEGD